MRNHLQLGRPLRKRNDPKRTIDEFFETAINYKFNPEINTADQSDSDPNSGSSLPDYIHRSRCSIWSLCYNSCPSLEYYIILVALGLANAGDATEISSLNFCLSDQVFTDQILNDDFKNRGATISAAIFLGMLIGGLLTGVFGDKFGRRPTLLLGLILDCFAGIGSAISPNFGLIVLFRFFAGLGVGTILSSLMPLATEISPPSKRGFFVTVIVSFFTFGMIYVAVAALIMFGSDDTNEDDNTWRWFFVVCTAPCILATILVYFFVPESARYLAMQNRMEEACEAANRIADAMGYKGPMLEVIELEHHYGRKNILCNPNSDPNYDVLQSRNLMIINPQNQRKCEVCKDTAKSVLKTYSKGLWKHTLLLQILTFAMSFGSGLNTWINEIFKSIHVNNVYMHSIYFSLSNIPGSIAAALLIERTGRSCLLASSMILSSLSLFVFVYFLGNDLLVTISACGFHAFLVISRSVLLCMTSELFPTEVRGTGVGICTALGRLASMLAQYVYGAFVDSPNKLVMVSGFSILFGAGVSIFMKDMSNKPLADGVGSDEGVVANAKSEAELADNEDGHDDNFEIVDDDDDNFELT